MDKEEKDDATLPLLPPFPPGLCSLICGGGGGNPKGGGRKRVKSGGGGENMWETPSVRPGVF